MKIAKVKRKLTDEERGVITLVYTPFMKIESINLNVTIDYDKGTVTLTDETKNS